jgi:hypothetical protein
MPDSLTHDARIKQVRSQLAAPLAQPQQQRSVDWAVYFIDGFAPSIVNALPPDRLASRNRGLPDVSLVILSRMVSLLSIWS